MKTLLWILLGTVVALPFYGQASADSLFRRGNRLYYEGKYAAAEQTYLKIPESGYHSAQLYYNLGNAAFKQNKLVDAVYYYEKALKLNPRFKAARRNLETARRGFQYKTRELPEVLYKKIWRNIVQWLPAEVWGFLSLALLYISLFVALVFMFSPHIKRRKAAFYVLPFTSLLWLFFLLAAYSAEKYNAKLYAIIFDKQTELHAGPSLNTEIKGKAYAGQKVEILEENEYWAKIKMPDGQIYWVEKQSYRKL